MRTIHIKTIVCIARFNIFLDHPCDSQYSIHNAYIHLSVLGPSIATPHPSRVFKPVDLAVRDAQLPFTPRIPRLHDGPGDNTGVPAEWSNQKFKTIPFQPPQLNTVKSDTPLDSGSLFFTPKSDDLSGDLPAVIMTDTGELVWNSPR